MSLHEYLTSLAISAEDPPFYALVMAAMRKADSDNVERFQRAFPETWFELTRRHCVPCGVLPEDDYNGEWPPPKVTASGW